MLIGWRGEKISNLFPHFTHMHCSPGAENQLPVWGEISGPKSTDQRRQQQGMAVKASPKNFPRKVIGTAMMLVTESFLERLHRE